METEDGGIAYEVSVWLRLDGKELDISGMIPSLTVAIAVDDLVNEENFETFTLHYGVAYLNPETGESEYLPGTLLLMPNELPEQQNDTAERFIVTVSCEENAHPVTAYNANALLVPYRHYALAADYVGQGMYRVQEIN